MKKLMVLAVVVLSACSSGSGGGGATSTTGQAGARPCREVWADGVTTPAEATLCDRGSGRLVMSSLASTGCADGGVLVWNDEGWGYVGEPWHRHEAGAELVAPVSERTACAG